MVLRVATYLVFLWLNVALGWSLLDGSIFYRGWFLVVLGMMTTLSLVSLTTTDPGRVKSDELCPTPTATEGGSQSAQQQYFTQFCSLCNNVKPERAHHCRICNRCVLRMDHHCHWVGRCVGADNYKSYVLTLFYGCLSSGVMLYVLWRQSGGTLEASSGWKCLIELVGIIVDGLLLLSIFCSVLYLLIWHGYLVASNVTTIEYFKWKRSMRDPGQYALSPGASIRLTDYDRGLLPNLREVLGNETYLWCWPGFGEGWRGGGWCCDASRKGVLVSGEGDAEGERVASSAGGWWSAKGVTEAKNAVFSVKPILSGFSTSVVAMEGREREERGRDLEMTGTGPRTPSMVSAINPL